MDGKIICKKLNIINQKTIDIVKELSEKINLDNDFLILTTEIQQGGLLTTQGLYSYLYLRYPKQLVSSIITIKTKYKINKTSWNNKKFKKWALEHGKEYVI